MEETLTRESGRRRQSQQTNDNPQDLTPKVITSLQQKKQKQMDVPETYTLLRSSGGVADWDDLLKDLASVKWLCPVDMFSNAVFARKWNRFAESKIGCKMELPHPRAIGDVPVYCVATLIQFAGYKALVRFENSGNGPHYFAWISFFSDLPKALGYSVAKNILVLPVDSNVSYDQAAHVRFVRQIYAAESLANSNSISAKHGEKVFRELNKLTNGPFKLNQLVEVMDKEDPLKNCLATVTGIIGDRVHVQYYGRERNDQGFFFNMKSELIHKLGWSKAIGQILVGLPENIVFPALRKRDFPPVPSTVSIQLGMVFEVRHPFYPSLIVPGMVKKKLRHGYFVAQIETNYPHHFAEFVFHVTSDYILPCNFSSIHKLEFEVPQGEAEDGTFSWEEFCEKKSREQLYLENPNFTRPHKFVKGCKLEAIDICEPSYLGPATVVDVAQHLIRIHFDGWSRSLPETYQWVSAFSYDIYPPGWAEMVSHLFQSHADLPLAYDCYSTEA